MPSIRRCDVWYAFDRIFVIRQHPSTVWYMTSHATPNRLLVTVALLATWLIWGSTFVAIHVTLETLPPLLMMGSRFVTAGLIATALGFWLTRGLPVPTRRHWGHASIIGTGLITIGMGATAWAATRLPTGIAALLVASAPLWVVLLSVGISRTRVAGMAIVGLGVGTLGIALLVLPTGGGASAGGVDPLAAAVLVLSNAAWAAASIFSPRATVPRSLPLACGMQMLTGGTLLCMVGVLSGELGAVSSADLTMGVIGSWLYLVAAGSIVGFLAYGWLLANVATSVATTHAFINPVVALLLGAVVLAEPIGQRTLLASAAVITAVVLLLRAERSAPVAPTARRTHAHARAASRAPLLTRTSGRGAGWSPTPTPAFAARRQSRPWQATDGMDALAIDLAFEQMQR